MKKNVAKLSLIFIVFALLAIICTAFFVCTNVAYAADDNTVEVIKAPVSNLEGNATAGKSTVCVYNSQYKLVYIPESYFLTSVETMIEGKFYQVKYAGLTFFLEEEPTTMQITVSENELLYPDVRLSLKEGVVITLNDAVINNEYTIKFIGYGEEANQIYVTATLDGTPYPMFISTDDVEPFAIPYQQKTQAERDALLASKEDPILPIGGSLKPNTSVALRIVIIIGIAIPTVIIVLLLFKPSKNERRYAKNTVRNSRNRDDIDYDDSRSYRRSDDRRDDRDYDDRYYSRRDDRDYDRRDDRGYRDDRDYDRRDDRR